MSPDLLLLHTQNSASLVLHTQKRQQKGGKKSGKKSGEKVVT
jgi:hypothetical protein